MTRVQNASVALAFLCLSTAAIADTTGPTWCQASQLSKVEKAICADPVLASSDMLISSLYKEVMSYSGKEGHEGHWPGEVISNQRDWVKKRNKSADRIKLLDAYMTRIPELYNALQNRLN